MGNGESMTLALSWSISFDRPEWLWLLAVIPLIVVVSRRSLAGLDRQRRIVAVALRSVVIALLALALARIEYVKRNDHVAVMFVLDKSRSIPEDLRLAAQAYVRKVALDADRDDRIGVIGFDGQADVDLIPSRGGASAFGFGMTVQPDRTDIAAGLRLALAAFPEGYARRVVILTDGNENVGKVTEEIETAIANKVAVDVIPLAYEHANEILFDRIVVPAHASLDTKIPLRLIVRSRQPARARLTLYHGDEEVPLAEPILTLGGGMRPEPFTTSIALHSGGVHRFDARLTPIPEQGDSIPENNRATAFTFVEAEGRVLVLTQPGSTDDRVLYEALKREQVEVEMRGVDQLNVDLLALQAYSVVILANISADTFTEGQHKALASYVKDFGGGLIMTGGDESFGAGGWIGSPVEEVSPVSFDVKHKKILPRGALAIIMHSCEIPRGNYWGEQVATAAVKTISSRDYLGVICYNPRFNGPHWDVPLDFATDKAAIVRKIKQMQIGDMPDFGNTMEIAIGELMAKKDASQRHMIIISDGDPSPPTQLTIQKMRDSRITCSTVGIGYGMHVVEKTLRVIARQTGGRFYPCKNPRQLPQIFVKEAKVVRRPLIDDRRFSPSMDFAFAQTVLGISGSELPALGGLVLTEPKADIIMPLVRKTRDGKNDPVLAHWNCEMGKMAVFTSGWWPKWGSDWAGWPKFGKFWAQVVRWAMRQAGSADFDIATRLEGDKGKVVIEALNKDASYLNFLQIRGLLTLPSMESKPLHLTQTGPGQYEATFEVNDNGEYLVNLRYTDPERESGLLRTGLSVPYSPEFRQLQTNMALLEGVVDRTGGRRLTMNADEDDVFSRDLPPSVSRQPMWRWVVQWLLLPLFLLDVAGRRLASALAMSIYVELAVFAVLFGMLYAAKATLMAYVGALVLAELVGWSIRARYIGPTIRFFTASATALSRAGQRSAASLAQLRDVRQKVREDLEARPAEGDRPPTIPLEPAADSKARFDAGDAAAAKPAGDLTEELGGAAASEKTAGPAATPKKPPGKPTRPEDLAARLRQAKQRARDQMKDRDNEAQ